jgi:hypothetical protein
MQTEYRRSGLEPTTQRERADESCAHSDSTSSHRRRNTLTVQQIAKLKDVTERTVYNTLAQAD